MILPEILYQPSEIDFKSLQAQFETVREERSGTVTGFNFGLYRIPANRTFIVQSLVIYAKPGSTQSVTDIIVDIWPSGQFALGDRILLAGIPGGAVNSIQIFNLQYPIMLPAPCLIWVSAAYSAGTNLNAMYTSMTGWLIPRGRLAY